MKSICVYCGSNPGADPRYRELARSLGGEIGRRGLRLVYGGGGLGLMGVVADAVLDSGGTALGVLPELFENHEVRHRNLPELRIVPDLHVRKATMIREADAFIALPGGFGTFDELCEVMCQAQLGCHEKPVGVLNVAGFFDLFLRQLDHAVEARFIRPEHRALLHVDTEPVGLLERMAAWRPQPVGKWLADPVD